MSSRNRQKAEIDKIVYVRPYSESEFRDELAAILRYMHETMGESWITPDTLDRICDETRQGMSGVLTVPEANPEGEPRKIKIYYDIDSQTDRLKGLKKAVETTTNDNIQSIIAADAESISPQSTEIIFITSKRANIHLVHNGLILRMLGHNEKIETALRVLAGIEDHTCDNTTHDEPEIDTSHIDYKGGRPPIGFESKNGSIVRAENYDNVARALKEVSAGDLSKRQAAKKIGCARATITNAIKDRRDLYFTE